MVIELESVKTHISAPAHPSATDGRVSGLVTTFFHVVSAIPNSMGLGKSGSTASIAAKTLRPEK